jgi:hypothetical protein
MLRYWWCHLLILFSHLRSTRKAGVASANTHEEFNLWTLLYCSKGIWGCRCLLAEKDSHFFRVCLIHADACLLPGVRELDKAGMFWCLTFLQNFGCLSWGSLKDTHLSSLFAGKRRVTISHMGGSDLTLTCYFPITHNIIHSIIRNIIACGSQSACDIMEFYSVNMDGWW